MIIKEFTQTSWFKHASNKVYYWSRAIIVLGIIFLINSWSGGAILISLGGLMLIIVYFFAAFEPSQEEPDWTIVFPELAGFEETNDQSSGATKKSPEKIRIEKLRSRIERLNKEIESI